MLFLLFDDDITNGNSIRTGLEINKNKPERKRVRRIVLHANFDSSAMNTRTYVSHSNHLHEQN